MKKTVGKIALITVICAVLLFLLLPFLETEAPSAAKGKQATPQIFTSNPLTSLVNRIAALFQGKQKRLERQAAQARAEAEQAKALAEEMYAAGPQDAARYSAANPQEQEPSFGTDRRFDYGNAAMQDANGNWVLVRQTAPEAAERGMHEINADDDAYDRYVRQERAARYTPGLGAPGVNTPDSALARIFSPIKSFLGLGKSAAPGAETAAKPDMLAMAKSEGLGGSQSKTSSSARRSQTPNTPDFNLPSRLFRSGGAAGRGESNSPVLPVSSAAEMFDPMVTIERIVEWGKENRPEDLTKEEQQAADKNDQAFIERKKAEVRTLLEEQLKQQAGDQPAVDRLPATIGCRGEGGSLYNNDAAVCDFKPSVSEAPEQWMSSEEQAKQKQLGRQKLTEKLNLPANHPPLPEMNVLVVLGKTNVVHPPEMEHSAEEHPNGSPEQHAQQLMSETYNRMLTQQGCDKAECYWIPNKIQQYPDVREAVIASGARSVEDPLDIYQKLASDILNEAITSDDPSLQEKMPLLQQILSTRAPAYIPVTKEQLRQINDRNDQMTLDDPKSFNKNVIFYVPDPQNARDIMPAFEEHTAFLVWGKDGSAFERTNTLDANGRAEILQQDLTDRAKTMAEFAKQAAREYQQNNVIDFTQRQGQKIGNMNTQQSQKELQKILQPNPSGQQTPAKKPSARGFQFQEIKR